MAGEVPPTVAAYLPVSDHAGHRAPGIALGEDATDRVAGGPSVGIILVQIAPVPVAKLAQGQPLGVELLGYGKANPAPSDLKLYSIYRYIVEEGEEKYLGYMTPVKEGNEESYKLLLIFFNGLSEGSGSSSNTSSAAPPIQFSLRALMSSFSLITGPREVLIMIAVGFISLNRS